MRPLLKEYLASHEQVGLLIVFVHLTQLVLDSISHGFKVNLFRCELDLFPEEPFNTLEKGLSNVEDLCCVNLGVQDWRVFGGGARLLKRSSSTCSAKVGLEEGAILKNYLKLNNKTE